MSDLGSALWSETDSANTASPPNGWPEGLFPSDVNNCARADKGGEKRWWARSNSTLTTAGSSTAYTLTYAQAEAAYYNGAECAFVAHATCGAAPTLNHNGLGARNLRRWTGTAFVNLAAGDIVANQPVRVRYNLADTTFDIVSAASGTLAEVPPGCITPYAGTTTPGGWLLCFGQAVSRTTYADLFAAIGTTYGVGDGSTTFNLPDLRGRIAAGKDDMGGSAASRLTGTTITGGATTLGNVGGAQTHTLSIAEMPSHGHNLVAVTAAAGFDGGAVGGFNNVAQTTAATGGGGAHNNVQPTIILNYIIKT